MIFLDIVVYTENVRQIKKGASQVIIELPIDARTGRDWEAWFGECGEKTRWFHRAGRNGPMDGFECSDQGLPSDGPRSEKRTYTRIGQRRCEKGV